MDDRENGRVTKGHQSDFNISITLAASGAKMTVGLTAHNTNKELLCLWWRPEKGCVTDHNQFAIAESIFYDIAEAQHKVPPMFQAMMQPLAQTPQPQQQQMKEVERQGQEKENQIEEETWVMVENMPILPRQVQEQEEKEKREQDEEKQKQEQEEKEQRKQEDGVIDHSILKMVVCQDIECLYSS